VGKVKESVGGALATLGQWWYDDGHTVIG